MYRSLPVASSSVAPKASQFSGQPESPAPQARSEVNVGNGQKTAELTREPMNEDAPVESHSVCLSGSGTQEISSRPSRSEALTALTLEGVGINAEGPRAWIEQQLSYLQAHPDMSTALKAKSADLNNAVGPQGRTALHLAVVWGNEDSVSALIANDANVEGTDLQARTALHFTAMRGREAMVNRLVALGAKVDASDSNGNTALHHAAAQGQLGVIKALIDANADIHIVNHAGMTALDIAAALEMSEIIDLLNAVR